MDSLTSLPVSMGFCNLDITALPQLTQPCNMQRCACCPCCKR
jgi:hypothetical protein